MGSSTTKKAITGRALAIAVVFALSGVAGLAYEIVWVRQITLLIGSTSWAVSLTVAGFLLGLTLGALLGGRLADRSRRWLLLYGGLEVGVGVFGVGLTELLAGFSASEGLAVSIAGSPAGVRILLAALLLLPPTVAMGATLPILTRWVARSLPDLGRHFTALYALNTLGAAVGCTLAGFLAIPYLGLTGTAWAAGAVNLVAAVSAFLLHFLGERGAAAEAEAEAEAEVEPGETVTSGLDDRSRRALIGIFGFTGFLAIAYEVLWFRSLGLFVRSSVYAFTALLSVFLLGLVIGAAVYALWLQPKRQELTILASAQVLQAFAGLLTLTALASGRTIDFLVNQALDSYLLALWLQAAAILLIPASIIGVTFPLVVQATATHLERVGRQVGWLYSLNTLGGIAGSLAVGFVLVPGIGTQWTFVLLALAGAGIAVWVILLDGTASPRIRRNILISAGLVVPAAFLLPPGTFLEAYAGQLTGNLLEVVEGRDGTIAVIEFSTESSCAGRECPQHCFDHPYRHRQVRYGSMSYASTIMSARRYMSALSNLAMLTGERSERALIVCFGTGITAGTTTLHDELKSLTLVDINKDVIAAARHFREFNHQILEDERVRVVVDDGRHFLAAASEDEQWDVISFEPPPPTAPGIVNLYTREFYAQARRHLAPGGRLTQWVPLQEQSGFVNRMLARALIDNFEHVSLWIPSRHEAVYLASDLPLEIDLPRLEEAFADPKLGAAFLEAGMESPYDILEGFVMGPEALRKWTEGIPPVTDNHPAVEYPYAYEDRAVSGPTLLDLLESPAPWIRGEFDRERLDRGQRRARALLIVARKTFMRDYRGAAKGLDAIIAEHGETPWLHHLRQDKLECMIRSDEVPRFKGPRAGATPPASE